MGDTYDYEPDPRDGDEYETTCNRCGKPGLTWGNDGRGWYLIDPNGYEHVCQTRDLHKMAGDDFEVLE